MPKPRIKWDKGLAAWLCGGLDVDPWYIDWFAGATPELAYENWKNGIGRYA